MEEVNHCELSHAWHHEILCQTLATQVALSHYRQILGEKQIAIRFENNYGVIILPLSQEDGVFEVWVLRFYGTGANDYQVAQYAPIPELNRGGFDAIIDLCKQVAHLPASKVRTGSDGQVMQPLALNSAAG